MNYEPIDEKDLDLPATKRDLQGFATREELPAIVTKAMKDVIKDEFAAVKEELSEWKDEILTSNDRVSKEYKAFDTEKAAINGNYKNLDKRVTKLEKATTN